MPRTPFSRFLYLRNVAIVAAIERWRVLRTLYWYRRTTSRLWFIIYPIEAYLAMRSPYWVHALYKTSKVAAYLLSFMRGLVKRIAMYRVGRLCRIVTAMILWRLARRYLSIADALIDFYRDVAGFWAAIHAYLWDVIRKENELFLAPVAYIEILPKTMQPAMIYVIQREGAEVRVEFVEQVARAIMELAMGRISIEEAIRRYPEIKGFLEALGIHAEELMTGRKFFAIVPVLEPIVNEATKGLRVWLYVYVCDAHAPLADPELAPSFVQDVHRAEFRWKWGRERVTEMGIPIPEEYLGFPADLLESEFYELEAMDFLVESPLLKTLIASSWGKPEEWWRIELAEPAWTTGELLSRFFHAVVFRRKPGARLLRTLLEFMGVR